MKSILLATTAAVAMTAHCQAADISRPPLRLRRRLSLPVRSNRVILQSSVLMPTKSVLVAKWLLRWIAMVDDWLKG